MADATGQETEISVTIGMVRYVPDPPDYRAWWRMVDSRPPGYRGSSDRSDPIRARRALRWALRLEHLGPRLIGEPGHGTTTPAQRRTLVTQADPRVITFEIGPDSIEAVLVTSRGAFGCHAVLPQADVTICGRVGPSDLRLQHLTRSEWADLPRAWASGSGF